MSLLDLLGGALPYASQYQAGRQEGGRLRREDDTGAQMDQLKMQQMLDEMKERRRLRKEGTPRPTETFTAQPMAVIDENGKPALVRFGTAGTTQRVDGFKPRPERPATSTMTPWQRAGFATEQDYLDYQKRERTATAAPPAAPTAPVLSEGERKTGALLQTAIEGYNTLEGILAQTNGSAPTLAQRAASRVGLGVGNVLSPAQLRQIDQAGYSLAEAWLRLTSGGAITPGEIVNVQNAILPQPGDDEATLEQKRRLRATYIQAIRTAAGRGAPTEQTPNAGVTTSTGRTFQRVP